MEHIKVVSRDIQKKQGYYEVPLVNYEKESINNIYEPYDINTVADEDIMSAHDESSIESKDKVEKQHVSFGTSKQKLSYVWIEAFFCAILLLGILIIQNVKNTEDLQLDIRQQIRHNLTADELIIVGNNIEEMLQKYKNVRP